MSTDPGDVVLDPFLGTGTTAIAAKTLGRHFVGIELDPEYVGIANDKLEKVKETTYQGFFVSNFLGKIQSIRDIDATKIFPAQLTTVEKKRKKENGNNGHSYDIEKQVPALAQTRLLEKKDHYETWSTPIYFNVLDAFQFHYHPLDKVGLEAEGKPDFVNLF